MPVLRPLIHQAGAVYRKGRGQSRAVQGLRPVRGIMQIWRLESQGVWDGPDYGDDK